MTPSPRRLPACFPAPFAVFLAVLLGFALWAAWGWLPQGMSGGELSLSASKAADFEQACRSVHGLAWWTPSFMQGHSLAGIWSTPLSLALLEMGRALFGVEAGYKIVALLALVASGLAMYRFAAALTGCAAAAALAGLWYVLSPEMAIRLAGAEHLAFGGPALCFPLAPLLLHALLRLRREEGRGPVFLAAAALATLFLLGTKVGVLFLPVAGGFALWLGFSGPALSVPGERRRFFLRCGQALLAAAPVVVLPMLPLLREQRGMALFAFDPLSAWQHAFSIKSVLSAWDRNGALLAATPSLFRTGNDAFYVGLPWCAALALAWMPTLRPWRATREGGLCLLFLALALGVQWLSFGAWTVAGAHWAILRAGSGLPAGTVALLWISLGAQGAVVWALAARGPAWLKSFRARGAAVAAYLFLPAFPLLAHIPLYQELRAPAAFWNVGGTLCIALAGALSFRAVAGAALERLAARFPAVRAVPAGGAIAGAAALLLLIDFAPYHAAFHTGGLPPRTQTDFIQAAAFLKQWDKPGSILAVSGRYFYLRLPGLTGRPLFDEAATRYYQRRAVRELSEAAHASLDRFGILLSAAGVGAVVIDKNDPDFSAPLDALLRERAPAVFENGGFAVLAWPRPAAPALAAGRVLAVSGHGAFGFPEAKAALDALGDGLWTVTAPPGIPAGETAGAGPVPLALRQPRDADYQTIALAPVPAGRPWVIVPEAYHPDWRAEADGVPLPVQRALGGLLAARAPRDGAAVTFLFRPPWWYDACIAGALAAWLFLLVAAGRFLARRPPAQEGLSCGS